MRAATRQDLGRPDGPEGDDDRDADQAHGARVLADQVRLPLMTHIATAPPNLADIAEFLRPGDILTHCCTGQANLVVDGNGKVYPFIRELWKAGMVLDVGQVKLELLEVTPG